MTTVAASSVGERLTTSPIVDLDLHLVDTDADSWRQRLRRHNHLVPKIVSDPDGTPRMLIAGRMYPQPTGTGRGSPLGIGAGGPPDANESRRAFLGQHGIVSAVLQPGFVAGAALAIAEADQRRPLLEAHNDWVMEEAEGDDRLIPAIAVDPLDTRWSLAEIRRCGREMGRVMACVTRPMGYAVRPFEDSGANALLRALADSGTPLFLHGGTGYYQRSPISEAVSDYGVAHLFSHCIEQMVALVDLVMCGAIANGLKVVHLEADAGWLGWLLPRIDRHLPGDIDLFERMQAQVLFTFSGDADEAHALSLAGLVECLAFGSDYPHWDALDVAAARIALEASLASRAREVLIDNAYRILCLPDIEAADERVRDELRHGT
jgi:predicted TIM-barrel fold metal-dependent hydrolase